MSDGKSAVTSTPLSVEAAIVEQPPPINPNAILIDEAERVAVEYAALKNEILRESVEDKRQDRAERKDYADRIFQLICCWLLAVGLIVFLQATSKQFKLADSVMLAILGGTTASVIGIFVIVANYLFPRARTSDEPTTKQS